MYFCVVRHGYAYSSSYSSSSNWKTGKMYTSSIHHNIRHSRCVLSLITEDEEDACPYKCRMAVLKPMVVVLVTHLPDNAQPVLTVLGSGVEGFSCYQYNIVTTLQLTRERDAHWGKSFSSHYWQLLQPKKMSTFVMGQTGAYSAPNDGVLDYSTYTNAQSRTAVEDYYRQQYDSNYISANGETAVARYQSMHNNNLWSWH